MSLPSKLDNDPDYRSQQNRPDYNILHSLTHGLSVLSDGLLDEDALDEDEPFFLGFDVSTT